MKPHLLFVNRVYPPQEGATGAILAELAEALAARGHRVTVLAGGGEGLPAESEQRGVRVVRVGRVATGANRQTLVRRALGFVALYPRFARAIRRLRPDVLVTKTDPPLQLVLVAAAPHGTRTVHWAQDLYPEIAEALGVIRSGGAAARVLRRLSTGALRRHDRIIAIGACMAERLRARGLPEEALAVIPNWALGEVAPVSPEANAFRRAHVPEGGFAVVYSGNMGRAHPFEAMLDAAGRLAVETPDVRFLFVGHGPRRAWVEAEVARRGLGNVALLPFQPAERLAESLSAADVHLVSMEAAAEGLVVPSKLYGVAAAGRPVVFLGPEGSEAARFVRRHACGDVLPAPTGKALAEALLAWRADAGAWVAAGARAQAAAEQGRVEAFGAFEALLTGDRVAATAPITTHTVA